MSQERIKVYFEEAAGLSETDAEAALKVIAKQLYEQIPAGISKTEARDWLLDFLKKLVNGDISSISKVSGKLPYEYEVAVQFVRLAAMAWLYQANIDGQQGLSPASSAYVEIGKFARPDRSDRVGRLETGPSPEMLERIRRAESQNAAKHAPAPRAAPARPPAMPRSPAGGLFRRMWNPFGRSKPIKGAPAPTIAPPPPVIPGPPGSGRVMNDPWANDDPKEQQRKRELQEQQEQQQREHQRQRLRAQVRQQQQQQQQQRQQQERAIVPEKDANEYRVWFGTNRANVNGRFTAERSRKVSYGFCDVYVPKSHKIGSLGSSFLTRLVTMTDDRLKLRRVSTLPAESLWEIIKAQLATVDEAERHAVVFIHGYNVSFSEAALRSAQIGFDLGVKGAMAFFSWPSKGTVQDYVADTAAIEASEVAIADFLVSFAEQTQAAAVHVIAHSMGNRGVLRAVTRIAAKAQKRTAVPFANFILAAPDVDAETFGNLAGAYAQLSRRTTLYVSERDRAVGLAAYIHDYPRVGFMPPISVFAGIDTISVSKIDLTMLGHGYVGEAREVLADMHSLIFQGLAPENRFSLTRVSTGGGEQYWTVRG